jgi:MarR family transcriptional regulator, negative regulator of the multidrug operon emrRAB
MSDRLSNLLGAVAIAAGDRIGAGAAAVVSHGGAHPAALVHLLAHPGRSIEDLRRVLRISQPGAVQAANRLEAAGLIERRPGADARTRALHLTAKGRRTARAVLAERAGASHDMLAALDADEQARLEPLLAKLVAGLAGDRPEALTVCRLCDRRACAAGPGAECPLEHTTRRAAA